MTRPLESARRLLACDDWEQEEQHADALAGTSCQETCQILLEALAHEDWQIRRAAIRGLGRLQSPQHLPHFLSALQDPFSEVRSTALGALEEATTAVPTAPLFEQLQHPNPFVRLCAAKTLTAHPAPDRFDELLECFQQETEEEALYGMAFALQATHPLVPEAPPLPETIQEYLDYEYPPCFDDFIFLSSDDTERPEDAIPTMLEGLGHPDPLTRWNLCESLFDLRGKWLAREGAMAPLISPLLQALQQPSHYLRAGAAMALGWLESTRAIPLLLQSLQDPELLVRAAASEALLRLDIAAGIPGLLTMLRARDDEYRNQALITFADLGEHNIFPLFLHALQREYERCIADVLDLSPQEQRQHAKQQRPFSTLFAALSPEWRPNFEPIYEEQTSQARCNIAYFLAHFGYSETIDILSNGIHFASHIYGERSIAALRQLDPNEVNEHLLTELQRPEADDAAPPVYALRSIQYRESIGDLVHTTQHGEHDARQEAIQALDELKAQEAFDTLRSQLQDPQMNVRREAVEALVRLENPDAIPHLLPLLEDKEEYVQTTVIRAFGRLAASNALSTLYPLLEHESEEIRRTTVQVLGEIGDARAISHLIPRLQDHHHWVQRATSEALQKLDRNETIDYLIRELSMVPDDTKILIIQTLGALNAQETIPFLIQQLQNSPRIALAAAQALEQMEAKQAIPDLLRSFQEQHEDTPLTNTLLSILHRFELQEITQMLCDVLNAIPRNVRAYAAKTLGTLNDPSVLPTLRECFQDRTAEVRANTLHSLHQLNDPELLPTVKLALQDEDPSVRERAAIIAGERQYSSTIPLLVQALHTPDNWTRIRAAQALAQLQAREAIPALIQQLDQASDTWLQREFLQAIAILQQNDALPLLAQWFEQGDWSIRNHIISSFEHIGTPDAIVHIKEALNEGPTVQAEAIQALGRLQQQDALSHIQEGLSSPSPDVRQASIAALAHLHPRPTPEPLFATLFDPSQKIALQAAQLLLQLDPTCNHPSWLAFLQHVMFAPPHEKSAEFQTKIASLLAEHIPTLQTYLETLEKTDSIEASKQKERMLQTLRSLLEGLQHAIQTWSPPSSSHLDEDLFSRSQTTIAVLQQTQQQWHALRQWLHENALHHIQEDWSDVLYHAS